MTMELEDIKRKIESLDKTHQLEVLRIIKKYPAVTLNENKSGIYINLTFLQEDVITELSEFIRYISDQEQLLDPMETQKQDFKNIFFLDKEDKDNLMY